MVLAFLLLWGCKQKEKALPPPSPEKATEIRNAVIEWMECEECDGNQLENVVKQGDIVIGTLAQILENGPSPAKREELREHLAATYEELAQYQTTHPEAKISFTKEEYINTYLDNYEALYRTRAATALGKFESSRAKDALRKATENKALRKDVRDAIDLALQKK
jgi:hypothetical protein